MSFLAIGNPMLQYLKEHPCGSPLTVPDTKRHPSHRQSWAPQVWAHRCRRLLSHVAGDRLQSPILLHHTDLGARRFKKNLHQPVNVLSFTLNPRSKYAQRFG